VTFRCLAAAIHCMRIDEVQLEWRGERASAGGAYRTRTRSRPRCHETAEGGPVRHPRCSHRDQDRQSRMTKSPHPGCIGSERGPWAADIGNERRSRAVALIALSKALSSPAKTRTLGFHLTTRSVGKDLGRNLLNLTSLPDHANAVVDLSDALLPLIGAPCRLLEQSRSQPPQRDTSATAHSGSFRVGAKSMVMSSDFPDASVLIRRKKPNRARLS
jgi:hypothetical protein